MEIFLASANFEEIQKAYFLPITGVLTNASILEKEKKPLKQLIQRIDEIGDLEFGLQISSTDEDTMMEEVRLFQSLLNNRRLHLKLPFCQDAFKVINRVRKTGMVLNLTAISTLPQACVALESCIDYLSIYVGRVTDAGGDGLKLLADVKQYASRNEKKTKILAASIRNIDHLTEVIKLGADAAAIPYSLLMGSLQNEITQQSINGFWKSWENIAKG